MFPREHAEETVFLIKFRCCGGVRKLGKNNPLQSGITVAMIQNVALLYTVAILAASISQSIRLYIAQGIYTDAVNFKATCQGSIPTSTLLSS
jgi:hypothetical protein